MPTLNLRMQRCSLRHGDKEVIQHELDRLKSRLRNFSPDLIRLELDVLRHPERDLFEGNIRLRIGNHSFKAARNLAPTLATLLRRSFEDIEEQLERYKSRLRREHDRRRASALPQLGRLPPS